MSCIINSSYDGKPSKTHASLIEYFGNTPNGQAKAAEEFAKLSSPEFLKKFHGENETPWFKLQDGDNFDRSRFNEQLEPELKKDRTGKLYYVNYDGSRNYVAGKPLAWLSNKAKRELVDNVIFSAVTQQGALELTDQDFEEELILGIDKVIEDTREWVEYFGGTDLDLDYLRQEVNKVMTARKLSLKDSFEVNRQLYDDINEEQEGEPEDDRTSNEVVRVESYLKNSKDTASANVKMLLSFIPNLESFTTDENGDPIIVYKENVLTKEVKTLDPNTDDFFESYVDAHELWRKFEDNLHDVFATVDSTGKVFSVLDKMKAKLELMAKSDPAIAYVKYYLDQFDTNKQIQFAQAFHKHAIVFNTTDVAGAEGNFTYKVIDPAAASNKNFKIRQSWNELLMESPYLNKVIDKSGNVSYDVDKVKIAKALNELSKAGVAIAKKNNSSFDQLSGDFKLLTDTLKTIGIDTEQLTEQHFQVMLEQMESTLGKKVSPNKFIKGLLDNATVALRVLQNTSGASLISSTGFKNPLLGSEIYKTLADSLVASSDFLNESTVMIAGGKTAWSMTLPSYIDITISKFKNGLYTVTDEQGNEITRNRYVEELQASSPFYRNHPWLDELHNKQVVENLKATVFSAFQRKGGSKYGKDNKDILFSDQLVDKIFKTLLPRVEANSQAIFYSPAAADKGRLNSISGFNIFSVDVDGNGKVLSKGLAADNGLDILVDNFISEYLRAKESYERAIKATDTSNLIVHYDLKPVNGKFQAVNAEGVPVGNAIQTQSLPELSPYTFKGKGFTDIDFLLDASNKGVKQMLYAYNGNTVEFLLSDFDVDINGVSPRQLLRDYLAKKVDDRIAETTKRLQEVGVVKADPKTNVIKNLKFDTRLWKHYSDKYKLETDPVRAAQLTLNHLVADYTVNGMISNSGYNKLFAGDVAYYKDSIDYNKRIPATYTDGKYLMIDRKEDINFKAAVIEGIEIPAKDLKDFEKGFKASIREQMKFMSEETKKIYTPEYIDALAKTYTSQYNKVNATDAQAWISLDRWKFLKQKLGEWGPKADEAFDRLQNGTFTYDDLKFAAQPLKGVYFERNNKTGIPTYLKYSQAVLVPGLIKGTQFQYLADAMQKQGVDEVITLDGVKVGALSPTTIHDVNGNFNSDIKLNPYNLSNLNWKLQQQLPVKGMKNSMDIGSQLQKNIVSNIFADGQYGSRNGQQVIDDMNRIVSDLTLLAFNETITSLGLNPEGKIENKDKFYNTLSKLALDKGVPPFAVEALNRGYDLDAIPQLRYKIQNVISAAFNNNIAKNQSPGGAFIQISNIGVTKQDISTDSGIFMLKDVTQLERPKLNTETKKVSSGQVFLPHAFVAKYIPNYKELTREQLLAKVDSELFKIIGYRIPNQKLSSNQPLEVVGILPAEMGDSIMMYTEITTQTGSDFDIDKTYVMLPAFEVEYSNKKDLMDSLFKMSDSDLLAMREDIEDYQNYVRENPLPEDKVDNPGSNKKLLINYLLDRGLVPAEMTEKYVKGLRYVKPSKENPNKKQLQNELFELYYDVLSSPLSYVDMMSGIDGSELKDEINRLHGKREELTSLQLLDPTYQLQIKFDNIVGKSGVGLTANQMVDHVYGQMAGMTMLDGVIGSILGNYVYNTDGIIDLSKVFDKAGNKITDSISMFLNAYVDIAKDPYVTKGNFNGYTSNVTFFLLRAGMPLKHVISYVGQPILKKLIAEYESTLSSLPSDVNKRQTLNEAALAVDKELAGKVIEVIKKLKSNEQLAEYGNMLNEAFSFTPGMESKATLDEALLSTKDNENFLNSLVDANIDSLLAKDADNFKAQITNLVDYLGTQFNTLEVFLELHKAGEKLSEQVLISKADVNGGGHDIVTHFTNNNRYNKVVQEAIFTGLEDKFAANTMLGSKTIYTMKYFSSLDENLFITMHPMIKPIYPMITKIFKGDDYATNAEVVKTVERSMYGSLVQMALQNTPFEITKQDVGRLMDKTTGLISRINSAKLNDKYADNKLIHALEVIKEQEYDEEVGGVTAVENFLSVDNFTRKPETILEDLSTAWEELLNSADQNDKDLAIDLIKYAIFTSGLSKNRHSIFEFMPISVADYMHNGLQKLKDTGIDTIFDNFIRDFIRHKQNSKYRISVKLKDLTAGVRGVSPAELGLKNLDKRIKLVRKNFVKGDKVSVEAKEKALADQFKIESYQLFKEGEQLMTYVGDIKSLDGTADLMVLAPTYSLGKEVGNGNIYEYTSSKGSVFTNNYPAKMDSIREGLKTIKDNFDFIPHTFDLSRTLHHYGQKIQVTEYNPEQAKQELIKRGLIKENKC